MKKLKESIEDILRKLLPMHRENLISAIRYVLDLEDFNGDNYKRIFSDLEVKLPENIYPEAISLVNRVKRYKEDFNGRMEDSDLTFKQLNEEIDKFYSYLDKYLLAV